MLSRRPRACSASAPANSSPAKSRPGSPVLLPAAPPDGSYDGCRDGSPASSLRSDLFSLALTSPSLLKRLDEEQQDAGPLALVHRRPAHDRASDSDTLDLVRCDVVRIFFEHHEISQLARGDG